MLGALPRAHRRPIVPTGRRRCWAGWSRSGRVLKSENTFGITHDHFKRNSCIPCSRQCLLRVPRVFTMRRPLPVFPDKQTSSQADGMSQTCHNWAHAPQQSAAIDHLVGWIATRAAPLCTTNSRAEPPRSPAGEPYAGAGASTGARHSNELPALTVASTCRRDAENERSHHALRLLTSCLSRDKLSLPLESKIRLRPWCPLPGRFRLWCKK